MAVPRARSGREIRALENGREAAREEKGALVRKTTLLNLAGLPAPQRVNANLMRDQISDRTQYAP